LLTSDAWYGASSKQKGLIVSSFSDFNISSEVISTLTKMGFTTPTEIQEKTLPILLNDKIQDLVALASTGTGKTAAFGIPLVEKIDSKSMYPQALVLSPTRELASQVADQLKKIGAAKNINVAVIYGGSSYRTQVMQLKKGAQIVVPPLVDWWICWSKIY
jgi:ATP-dependent RNA helicase DeaD